MNEKRTILPRGIVSVVQTAFTPGETLDMVSVDRLLHDALDAGVDGFLVAAVASEVGFLQPHEKAQLVRAAVRAAGRVPVIAGASAATAKESAAAIAQAEEEGATAALVAVPAERYGDEQAVVDFFRPLAGVQLPLVVQDLQFNGPGLSIDCIRRLRDLLPQLMGLKIETVPAGPKYSAVREVCGPEFWVAGGWAVPQMIEALDRGVDAMVPESSMVRIYRAVIDLHSRGRRNEARELFRALLPILSFSNQEIATSVAFFKRLLVRKKIFASAHQRMPMPAWDAISERRANELIDEYLQIEVALPRRAAAPDEAVGSRT